MPEPFPPPATQPTAQHLRLAELTPGRFQSFCRDLVQALPGVVECHQYGVEGDPQGGIDLVATMTSGDEHAYQCRRVQTFGATALRRLTETVTYPAREYFALIACRATAALRNEEKLHPKWHVWEIDDISAKVRALPLEIARRIVRTNFGGQACRDFLGVQPFSAFLLPNEFFAPLLDHAKMFNHTWHLVGRKSELESLRAFAASEKLVYVLSGRGGIGKSKILRAFASEAEQTAGVYFAQHDVPVTPDALSELPVAETILVIDDAHRRKDLGLLLTHAVRTRTKLVLATRPQLCAEIPALAAQHQVDLTEIERPPRLDPLSFDDMLALAKEVLGPKLEHLAEALASVTTDCALITVVGGALLRDKQVHPTLLANYDEFREAALARFFGEIVEHAEPGSSDASLRKLLALIAALAPVQPASQRFTSSAEAMTGFDHETAAMWCTRLEADGILARHDGGYRIVPDVLSDYILGKACVLVQGTQGFVERLVGAVGSFDPALLRNLAAVDWRSGKNTGTELSVLGSVWGDVVATFEAASNSERSRMLREMKELGYFLPQQMLDLSLLALDYPSQTDESGPFAVYVRTTHEDVLAHLPEVVRFAAYNEEVFDRACDLLWRLTLDSRLTKPAAMLGEKGALGVLTDMMSYALRKPPWVQERLLARAQSWLKFATTVKERIALAALFSPLFLKTGTDYTARESQITTTSFTVSGGAVDDFRNRAFTALKQLLEDPDRLVVGAAVKTLKHALDPPHSLGGLVISDEFREDCEPTRFTTLEILRELVTKHPDPVIGAQVTDIVTWYVREDTNAAIREAATGVLNAISRDLHAQIAMAIHDPWGHRFWPHETDEVQAVVTAAAIGIAETMEPPHAIEEIGDVITSLQALDMHATPHILLGTVARVRPVAAAALLEAAVLNDASTFAPHAGTVLGPLHSADPTLFHTLVEKALDAGSARVCASIAGVYRWWLAEEPRDPRDVAVVQRLFVMGGDVAISALGLLPELARYEPRIAAELLAGVSLDAQQHVAVAFAQLFQLPNEMLYDVVSPEELHLCVLKFIDVPQLDEWHLIKFLKECSVRVPLAVIDLLIERVRHERSVDVMRYTAIPLQMSPLPIGPATVEDTAYADCLQTIAMLYLEGTARYDAPKVFVLAAGAMNPTAAGVLRDLSARRTDPTGTFVANCLRGNACRTLILTDSTFASAALG